MKKPIGVFDSGIGGLTVLRELQRTLPHENFVYFADSAHLPYGEKTPEQIIDYARQTVTWMQDDLGAKLVVAACHTSSTLALDIISREFSIPVIGTIHPMVETVLTHYANRRIGIIATPASVQSGMHQQALIQSGFTGTIHSISCPGFVPIIESGRLSGPELLRKTHEYLGPFQEKGLDTLIYGCTHYPWIAETIQHALPPGIECIDPAASIATKVLQELYRNKTLNTSHGSGTIRFYCSSSPDRFSTQVNLLMSIPEPEVTLVTLESQEPLCEKRVVNQ